MGGHAVIAGLLARFEREHREALAMLDQLEAAAGALRERRPAADDLGTVRAVHEFLSTAVRQHNDDEERDLFPFLADAAVTEAFVQDHRRLRALERELAAALAAPDAAAAVPPVALELAALLRNHIHREDEGLFPLVRTGRTD